MLGLQLGEQFLEVGTDAERIEVWILSQMGNLGRVFEIARRLDSAEQLDRAGSIWSGGSDRQPAASLPATNSNTPANRNRRGFRKRAIETVQRNANHRRCSGRHGTPGLVSPG